MKSYLATLAKQHEEILEQLASPAGEAGINKINGDLVPGARCAWCYRDDVEFWKRCSDRDLVTRPDQWPYQGFIVPFPETNGRHIMQEEDICVVVVDYPIEKENPVTEWVPLATTLSVGDLYAFHVFPVKPLVRKRKKIYARRKR